VDRQPHELGAERQLEQLLLGGVGAAQVVAQPLDHALAQARIAGAGDIRAVARGHERGPLLLATLLLVDADREVSRHASAFSAAGTAAAGYVQNVSSLS